MTREAAIFTVALAAVTVTVAVTVVTAAPRGAGAGGAQQGRAQQGATQQGTTPPGTAQQSSVVSPAAAPGAALRIIPVRGNIYMISGAGANVVVSVGKDGVLLVDTGSGAA